MVKYKRNRRKNTNNYRRGNENDFKATVKKIISNIYGLINDGSPNVMLIARMVVKLRNLLNYNLSSEEKIIFFYEVKKLENKCLGLELRDTDKKILEGIIEIEKYLKNKIDLGSIDINKIREMIENKDNLYMLLANLYSFNYLNSDNNIKVLKLFEDLLKKYCNLDTLNVQLISYYQAILNTFFMGNYREDIIKKKNYYLDMINKLGMGKIHVKAMKLFFSVPSENLLQEVAEVYNAKAFFRDDYVFEDNDYRDDLADKRQDFSSLYTITIDSRLSDSSEDAISLVKNRDGTYTLYFHIIDIPSIIPFDSEISRNAYYCINNVYLPDRNNRIRLGIYPKKITDELGAFRENKISNTITYQVQLDTNFDVIKDTFRVSSGKVKIDKSLTNKKAIELLEFGYNSKLREMLINLSKISKKISNDNPSISLYRNLRGYVMVGVNSYEFDESAPVNLTRGISSLIKTLVAEYFRDKGYPYIWLNPLEKHTISEYNNMLQSIVSNFDYMPEDEYEKIRRAVSSEFSNTPVNYLGVENGPYCVVSALRNYPATFNQYIVHDLVFKDKVQDSDVYKWEEQTKMLFPYLNSRQQEINGLARTYNLLRKRLKR